MELLRGLGVNSTIGYQLVIFLITYVILHQVLFRPYYKAYLARIERTMGRTEMAERFTAEAQALQAEYESKARALSTKYRELFEASRVQANKEQDEIVNAARTHAKTTMETAKQKITSELTTARKSLEKETPVLADTIMARLLGKDLQ